MMNTHYTVPELYVRGIIKSWVKDGADFTVEEVFTKVSKMLDHPINLTPQFRTFIESSMRDICGYIGEYKDECCKKSKYCKTDPNTYSIH